MGKIIGHIKKYSWRYVFVLGFVVGLLFCLRAEIRNFSFDPKTGHLDVEMREQNDIEYFNSVWEDSDRLKIHLLLLAEKGVYRADDPRLVSAIVELCEPIPQGPLDEHLALSQKCANKPVPKLLRDLKQRGSPPFHPVGRFVSIGVPGKDDQPRIGKASTCLNGELYRRKLRLVNTDNEKTVTVLADRSLWRRCRLWFDIWDCGSPTQR